MSGDFIKIDRKILEWEWYKNLNTCRLFFHFLLKANWKDGKFEGKIIPRGSFATSINALSNETGLTTREVRTAISHLKSTGEVTSKSYSKFTVITVKNYSLYQASDKLIDNQSDKQVTSKRQANDKQTTTIEEYKEIKKNNNNSLCKKDAQSLFEELWKLYPVKRGKGQVSDTAKMRLLKIGKEQMIRAIERYKLYVTKQKNLNYQNGSTFFNSGYVDYIDENYTPSDEIPRNQSANNRFNNFEGRTYDMSSLEQQLLNTQH